MLRLNDSLIRGFYGRCTCAPISVLKMLGRYSARGLTFFLLTSFLTRCLLILAVFSLDHLRFTLSLRCLAMSDFICDYCKITPVILFWFFSLFACLVDLSFRLTAVLVKLLDVLDILSNLSRLSTVGFVI